MKSNVLLAKEFFDIASRIEKLEEATNKVCLALEEAVKQNIFVPNLDLVQAYLELSFLLDREKE